MSIVELRNISKEYGIGDASVRALNSINLVINKGDFIAIVGKSGSGKSTLLNIVGCIDSPSSGEYFLNGKKLNNVNDKGLAIIRNKNIGFVLQYFGLINEYTVYKNIEIPLRYAKQKKGYSKDRIKELLKLLKIEDKIDKYPYELSGGQNQRVAIARALANDPDIILADEPTGALDKGTSEEVMKILYDLNKVGKTIIMVTHDESIYRYCNRKIIIEDGELNEFKY